MRRDPNASLQAAKPTLLKISPQFDAERLARFRKIEEDEAPDAVPCAGPFNLGIASAQNMQTALGSKPVKAIFCAMLMLAQSFGVFPVFWLDAKSRFDTTNFRTIRRYFDMAPASAGTWST